VNLLTNASIPLQLGIGKNSQAHLDFSGGVMRQAFWDARLANVNNFIADGTITAYKGVGTVLTQRVEDVLIVKGLHPLNPVPEDGDPATTPGAVELRWVLPNG